MFHRKNRVDENHIVQKNQLRNRDKKISSPLVPRICVLNKAGRKITIFRLIVSNEHAYKWVFLLVVRDRYIILPVFYTDPGLSIIRYIKLLTGILSDCIKIISNVHCHFLVSFDFLK